MMLMKVSPRFPAVSKIVGVGCWRMFLQKRRCPEAFPSTGPEAEEDRAVVDGGPSAGTRQHTLTSEFTQGSGRVSPACCGLHRPLSSQARAQAFLGALADSSGTCPIIPPWQIRKLRLSSGQQLLKGPQRTWSDPHHFSLPQCVTAVMNLEGPIRTRWQRIFATLMEKQSGRANNRNSTLVGDRLTPCG